jgi:hypothetical protein
MVRLCPEGSDSQCRVSTIPFPTFSFEIDFSFRAVKTPQILELSGIGSPSVLDPLGIRVKVELPGVGENVQEHHYCTMSLQLRDNAGHETLDMFRQPGFAEKAMDL